MVLLGNEAQVEARSVHLEIVIIRTPDRCTVCSKSTIGLQIIFDAPSGTPRCVGHLESRFSPFLDGVSVSAR
jgi:hypothetical protein